MQVLAIDVGATIKYGICNEDAQLSFKGQEPTPLRPQDTVDDFIDTVKWIYREVKSQGADFEGIALSIPGCVNKDGSLKTGGAIFYNEGQPIADLIQKATSLRPSVENDAKAAAAAELWLGSLRGVNSGALLSFGTGLGGAIVVNGQILNGPSGAAGELSSYMIRPNDFTNHMNSGAMTISTTGLIVRTCEALNLPYIHNEREHIREYPLDGRKVFALFYEGNEKVKEVINEFGYDVGKLIFNMGTILDLERVAIGGGISAQSCLMDAIRNGVERAFAEGPSGGFLIQKPEIVNCQFHNDANLIGATHHYMVEHGML